jgi:hypothetical protein
MGLLGGSTNQSSAQSTGSAAGGFGLFSPENNISVGSFFKLPTVDLTDPYELAALSLIAFAGWWAWKRYK